MILIHGGIPGNWRGPVRGGDAQIKIDSKSISLGYFKNNDDEGIARQAAEKRGSAGG